MGLVEAALGGTFFLDEIAEAHSSAIAKQRENQQRRT
jgi:transcriptional regulator with PAS, ATPase and Fis domain